MIHEAVREELAEDKVREAAREQAEERDAQRQQEQDREDEDARRARLRAGMKQFADAMQATQDSITKMHQNVNQTLNNYDTTRAAQHAASLGNSSGASTTGTANPMTGSVGIQMSDACLAVCRRYKACFDPYNACYSGCNNHSNVESDCQRSCNSTFRACKQSSGPVCGLEGVSSSGCCACSD